MDKAAVQTLSALVPVLFWLPVCCFLLTNFCIKRTCLTPVWHLLACLVWFWAKCQAGRPVPEFPQWDRQLNYEVVLGSFYMRMNMEQGLCASALLFWLNHNSCIETLTQLSEGDLRPPICTNVSCLSVCVGFCCNVQHQVCQRKKTLTCSVSQVRSSERHPVAPEKFAWFTHIIVSQCRTRHSLAEGVYHQRLAHGQNGVISQAENDMLLWANFHICSIHNRSCIL